MTLEAGVRTEPDGTAWLDSFGWPITASAVYVFTGGRYFDQAMIERPIDGCANCSPKRPPPRPPFRWEFRHTTGGGGPPSSADLPNLDEVVDMILESLLNGDQPTAVPRRADPGINVVLQSPSETFPGAVDEGIPTLFPW